MLKRIILVVIFVMTLLSNGRVLAVDVCLAVGDLGSFLYINCQDYLKISDEVDEIQARIGEIQKRIERINSTLETNANDPDWIAQITPTVQGFNDELATLLAQQEALLLDLTWKDPEIRARLGNKFVDTFIGDLPAKVTKIIGDIEGVESDAFVLLRDLQALAPVADPGQSTSDEVAPALPAGSLEVGTIVGTFQTNNGSELTFDGSHRASWSHGHFIIDNISGHVVEGHWVYAVDYDNCEERLNGSLYGGRFEVTFNAEGTSFEGAFGVCDADLTEYWAGSLVPGTGEGFSTGTIADSYIDGARDACANFSNGLERNACIFQEGWLHLQAVKDCNLIGETGTDCINDAQEFYGELYTEEDIRELAAEYSGLDDPYAGLAVVTCELNPATDAQGEEVSLGVCAEVEYAAIGPDRAGDSDNDGINNSDDYCPEIARGDNPSLDKPGCPATSD
ncbi:hypothetical protein ACFLYO_00385 [Chloroflexota bacterium]